MSLSNKKVKTWFDEAVKNNLEAPYELRMTLLKPHPRIDEFVNKMRIQLNQAQGINFKRGKIIKESTMKDLLQDMVKLFMKGMEGEATRRHESDLARRARENKADEIKEFESVLEGNPTGEFAEAGVVSDEKIDAKREKILEAQDRQKQAEARS